MNVSETDKLVAATLAAAKAGAEKLETPLAWVMEYERILKILSRRNDKAAATAAHPAP